MNPEDMTDEQLNDAVTKGILPEDESPQEEIPEPAVDEPEEPEIEEPEDTPEEPVEEEQPVSRREQLRIQQLLHKYPDLQERAQPTPKSDFIENLDADPEVIQRLQQEQTRVAEESRNDGLRQAEYLNWNTSLKIDAPIVAQKYAILDKNNTEAFDPAVADALNSMYLQNVGFDPATRTVNNPNMSYVEFVEAHMELVDAIASQKNAVSVKNIARQTAATGLRPDGSSAKRLNLNQAPQDMSIEELYASIGQAPPSK